MDDTQKAKQDAAEKAKKENADKLAAAQKEMAERYPEHAPFYSGEVVTEEVVAEGYVEPIDPNKPRPEGSRAGTVIAEGTVEPQLGVGSPQGARAPAVPKKG